MILDGLLQSQKDAVTHEDGPLLVLAGPGSGKTMVVTRRIAHLISRGILPAQILALTFTNKAADEMSRRVNNLVSVSHIWISTFHSFCAKLLRIDGNLLGYERGFSIADEDVSRDYLKTVCAELGVSDKEYPIQLVSGAVKMFKHRGISPAEAEERAYDPKQTLFANIYKRYAQILQAANTLDFDDLLCETVRLLAERAEVRDKYQRKFRHILVDEYQDTNLIQYRLLRLLAGDNRNVCVVGDPDQSIYAWRGANIENILNFEKDFPGTKVVRLEHNFRSTKAVLRAAQSVIVNNSERKEKGLVTDNADGEPVTLLAVDDEEQEGREIAGIAEKAQRAGLSLAHIAVFYRTNAQSRALEEAFRVRSIPYNVVGSANFYDRAEVRDLLAVLRLLENPKDTAAFDRVVNNVMRGVGAVSALKLKDFAKEKNLTLLKAVELPECAKVMREPAFSHCRAFAENMERLHQLKESGGPAEVVRQALNLSGMRKALLESKEEKSAERLRNLEEMVSDAVRFEQAQPDAKLHNFLEKVALISDIDTWDDNVDRVSLMTLHSSKGLEFPLVFVAGAEDGLLPIENALNEQRRLEEERRLFFVGMTRAKKRLFISYADTRTVFGISKPRKRSRFIEEMPLDEVRIDDRRSAEGFNDPREANYFRRTGYVSRRTESDYSRRFVPNAKKNPAEEEARTSSPPSLTPKQLGHVTKNGQPIALNSKVQHAAFGPGRVIEIAGTGRDANVVVDFSRVGRKTLKLAYAPLEVV